MPSERLQKTLGDYVAIAISPVLIIALVGSLVYFLLEVLYRGQYESHLQWVFACFIFAAVLIARISMRPDTESRAGIYGIVLAGAMGIALFRFVEYPKDSPLASIGWFVNMALVGLVWWCAHKLTWDCTMVDEDEDATGEGLLDAAGLSERVLAVQGPMASADDDEVEPAAPKELTWWDRYQAWRERRRKRPHTPGVWVVYFSLASLPLFGLGQLTIPATNQASRRYIFALLSIYVTSGLLLLLTTSFLGLRRYLRQRKVSMPLGVVSTWLLLGVGMVLALVVVAAVIPRPDPEFALFRLRGLPGSRDRDASRYAINRRDAGKNGGRSSRDKQDDPGARPGSGQQRDSQGQQVPGKSGSGGRNQGGKDPSQGQRGEQGGQRGQNQGQGQRQGNQGQNDKQGRQQGDQQDGQQGDRQRDQEDQDSDGNGSSEGREESSDVEGAFLNELGPLGSIIKWIIALAVLLVVAYFVIRFMANFAEWARGLLAWWHGLFDRGAKGKAETEGPLDDAIVIPPPPFADFSDPFADGSAERRTPNELVRYTFAALHSWAWEQRMERQAHETPIEFGDRVAGMMRSRGADLPKLADLYSRVTYARQTLNKECLPVVKNTWRMLTEPVHADTEAHAIGGVE